MISETPIENMVTHDFGRPTMINDAQWDFWKKFFDLVETSPIRMLTNGAYDFCRDHAHKRTGYMGGGFKFVFGFESEKDRKTFCDEVDKL